MGCLLWNEIWDRGQQRDDCPGNGSRKLRRLGSLESLEIHECTLDAKVVRSIGGIVSLKRLLLIDVELPSDTI